MSCPNLVKWIVAAAPVPEVSLDLTRLCSFMHSRVKSIRRILNVAHQDWRWLRGVPKIRMLKEPRRRVRFLRREEADRLIEALADHMKPIVEFALATGCRAGEILGLEWSRVDLDRKVAWLDHGTTKSGEGRGIPLNADAVAALESTRGQHPRWCFTFAVRRIQKSSTAWDKAKRRAGIEDFRFHDTRHTWASWHVQSGTSLPELMELGGWKSYEMVLRYAHLAPEKLSFVAGRIERKPVPVVDGAQLVDVSAETSSRGANVAEIATFALRSVN